MMDLNIFNHPDPLSIYVVRVDGEVLGCIDDIIDESTASVSIGLNEQYELRFEAKNTDSSWYEFLIEGMYLYVDKIGRFKMEQPSITLDGQTETKSVTAYSCESELEDKVCTLPINIGTRTSLEYQVEYEDGETENLVNPYTGVPYDWIVLYNMFPQQLTAFKELYDSEHFGEPDEHGDTNVTTQSLIDELTEVFSLVPRLKSKIVYEDSEDGGKDSVLIEYVIITYDDNDPSVITQYTLTSEFGQRISDLISYYGKYRGQLSLLDIVLEKTGGGWTIGNIYGVDDGDYSLCNMKYQFDINESIYSFLTQTMAQTMNCVVSFDIVQRKVNITPIEHVGNDTGIIIGYDNLVNTLNIAADEDRLSTRLKVSGGEDLDITRVNFGSNLVDDITYKLNARDANGNRLYVSDALANKYMDYIEYRESQREQYIQLSKDYETYTEQIAELENRVPNDNLRNDWSTFSMDELTASLTSFKNLLATLQSLYKEDYGTAGLNPDGSIDEDFIKDTEYWYDYEAYKNIIDEIECAIAVYPYYDEHDRWTDEQIAEFEEKIKAWETEWSLYGTKELQAKVDVYKQNMDVMLADQKENSSDQSKSAIIPKIKRVLGTIGEGGDVDELPMSGVRIGDTYQVITADTYTVQEEPPVAITCNVGDYLYVKTLVPRWDVIRDENERYLAKSWEELTNEEKALYGNSEELYYYDTYMDNYDNWVSAKEYLDGLLEQLSDLNELRDSAQSDRNDIRESVELENYFTADECVVLYRLFRDAEYSNENILSTSIDTVSEKIDTMVELLEDAKDQASIVSRPQLQFSVDADNMLAIPEFKSFWDSFIPGNYILVQYKDNTYVKLRMIRYSFNPCLPTSDSFEITFSNFIRSRSYYRDWASIFGNGSSSGVSSYGSSGGGGGDAEIGEADDIDITISNTMLSKLLNTEMFGSRVTNVILDTIDVNALTARTATFGGLADGTTTIDGRCITTGYIKSYNYNGDSGAVNNTSGSIINLDSGDFNFAGGKIVYSDGSLRIITNDLYIGAEPVATNSYVNSSVVQAKNDINTQMSTKLSRVPPVAGNSSIDWDGTLLGIRSGDYAVEVGGDGIEFKYGGIGVASINQNRLVIGRTITLDEMQIGVVRDQSTHEPVGTAKWSWKYDKYDDSLYLKWIGGDVS